ncbi:MAG: glycoside hydrolase family 5 protein [Phycisphaerales bacterium]|nr:glycoside hydrolase family 5 protein [Phycisphaerales bacterium]
MLRYRQSIMVAVFGTIVFLCGISGVLAQEQTKVSIEGGRWLINGRPTHPDSASEGLLMNVRMVNSVYEDIGRAGADLLGDFDPQENTRRFIARIGEYAEAGVAAFTISLQGGMSGYEGAINTAFNPDGSLREPYMRRVAQVIEACDAKGVVVILSCFYQRQHSHELALSGREAIIRAVENVGKWISQQRYTNVILEVANEYSHGGFHRWNDSEWLTSDEGQIELIRRVRAAVPGLLVSTSGMGDGSIPESIAHESDFILIHFNNTPLDKYAARIAAARQYGKPVVCNEDNKIGEQGAAAVQASVAHGAGWGYMHVAKNQRVPFEYDGTADDPAVYSALRELTRPGGQAVVQVEAGPSVLISRPGDGAVFTVGTKIHIEAAVSAGNAQIGELRFYANDKQIGRCATAPWRMVWDDVPVGAYDLTAVLFATDGQRLVTSVPVDIEVTRPDGG